MAVTYNQVKEVFEQMMTGLSLTRVLKDKPFSVWDFYSTVDSDPSLSRDYARAQQIRGELLADEVIDISDNEPDPQKARNRIDSRKWYASKMQPSKYGDRIDLNITQTVDIGAALLEAKQRTIDVKSEMVSLLEDGSAERGPASGNANELSELDLFS